MLIGIDTDMVGNLLSTFYKEGLDGSSAEMEYEKVSVHPWLIVLPGFVVLSFMPLGSTRPLLRRLAEKIQIRPTWQCTMGTKGKVARGEVVALRPTAKCTVRSRSLARINEELCGYVTLVHDFDHT